jgi:hypothetical protein
MTEEFDRALRAFHEHVDQVSADLTAANKFATDAIAVAPFEVAGGQWVKLRSAEDIYIYGGMNPDADFSMPDLDAALKMLQASRPELFDNIPKPKGV